MYSANQITDWVLQMAQDKNIEISQMKLQKLLYYIQGYSLGMTGERAFSDAICANTHGPVVENMRRRFRNSGSQRLYAENLSEIPGDISGLISSVLRDKGGYTARELRDMTHKEPPFDTTEQSAEITTEKMRDYFAPLFWGEDEEDEYAPSFDTTDEEKAYLRSVVPEREREAILNHVSR